MPLPPNTVVVIIDPYNDFLHPEGKLTPRMRDLDDNGTIQHLQELVATARHYGIPIYYGLHQQCNSNTFHGWNYMTPSNKGQQKVRFFEEDSFGAKIYEGLEPDPTNGDVVVSRHWNSEYDHLRAISF